MFTDDEGRIEDGRDGENGGEKLSSTPCQLLTSPIEYSLCCEIHLAVSEARTKTPLSFIARKSCPGARLYEELMLNFEATFSIY